MMPSKCKGCGATIWWGITPAGKRIPLVLLDHLYVTVGTALADRVDPLETRVFRSHFRDCPAVEQFAGKAKAAA